MAAKESLFYTLNAQTGLPLSTPIPVSTSEEIANALEAAAAATLPFAASTPADRSIFFEAIMTGLIAKKEAILKSYCEESGLPEGRAEGEFQRTIGQIEHFNSLLKSGRFLQASITRPADGVADIRKLLYPIGPIIVFGASNFPLAFSTAGGDTISALAAGCPVLVKAHPYHALTSSLVAEVIQQAAVKCKLPKGVFAHLTSDQHHLGQQLVLDPRVKGVGFTGSFRGGKALFDLAHQRKEPIPVFAEMGSVNPVFLLPEILTAKGSTLAAAIAQSVTLGNGQFCTNPGVIALPKEEGKPFIKALKNALETGSKGVMVHPNIQESYDRQLEALKKTQPEVEVFQSQDGGPALGVVAAQTVWEKPEVLEEVFGPFTLIVVHGTASEMETTASVMEGQLTATLQGTPEELKKYSRLQGILQQKVGRLLFEGVPTGVSVCQTMMHGGPFPASTDSRYTAVGSDAIYRWLRPLAFQDAPQQVLPLALQNQNPLGIERKIDNQWTNAPI